MKEKISFSIFILLLSGVQSQIPDSLFRSGSEKKWVTFEYIISRGKGFILFSESLKLYDDSTYFYTSWGHSDPYKCDSGYFTARKNTLWLNSIKPFMRLQDSTQASGWIEYYVYQNQKARFRNSSLIFSPLVVKIDRKRFRQRTIMWLRKESLKNP